MNWKTFEQEFPSYGDNILLLVTDLQKVYLCYEDKGSLWFITKTDEKEESVINRLTHWMFIGSLHDFPTNHLKGEDLGCKCIELDYVDDFFDKIYGTKLDDRKSANIISKMFLLSKMRCPEHCRNIVSSMRKDENNKE